MTRPDPLPGPDLPTLGEARSLWRLAWPVVLTNLATMSLGIVDTLMVGKLGPKALAALALGHTFVFGTLIVGMGLVMGISPIVSQAHGRGDVTAMGRALQRGVLAGLAVSVVVAGSWFWARDVLVLFGQDPELAALAHDYVVVQVWSVPAFLVFCALRDYLACRGIMGPALWTSLLAIGFNALFNWVLIFGKLGAPALGVRGAGIATSLTRVVTLAALWFIISRADLLRNAWVPWSRAAFARRGMGDVLRHGLPIAIHLGLEIWSFQTATLLAGKIGGESPDVLAAHIIVLQYASITFMIPMSFATAATTRVGNLIGAGQPHRAQRAAWSAYACGTGAMAVSGVLFLLLRDILALPYSKDPDVLALTALVFPIAAAFQIFDGAQVVGAGILRGMGKTAVPAWAGLLGYWMVGLPLGWYLGLERGLGLAGVWWGLAAGLASVAVTLVLWIRHRGPVTISPVELRS